MEFALLIYLGSLMGNLGEALIILAAVIAIGSALTAAVVETDFCEEKDFSGPVKWLKISLGIFVFAIFIPSSTTFNTMIVAYGAQTVATTDAASERGGKSVRAINKLLDDYLEEDSE